MRSNAELTKTKCPCRSTTQTASRIRSNTSARRLGCISSSPAGVPCICAWQNLDDLAITVDIRTRTEQIAVAIDIVDTSHWRPIFIQTQVRDGIGGVLARVAVLPAFTQQFGGGVRCIFQRVVLRIPFTA